jgi:hypothetical protein
MGDFVRNPWAPHSARWSYLQCWGRRTRNPAQVRDRDTPLQRARARLANLLHGGAIYARSESSIDHSLTEPLGLAVVTKKLKVSTGSVTRA